MGHYASEMMGYGDGPWPDTEGQRKLDQEWLGRGMNDDYLRELGYDFAVLTGTMDICKGSLVAGGRKHGDEQPKLLHHKPCGQAVFDAERHGRFCPASPH